MIGNNVAQKFEPEKRKLSQHLAFVGDLRRQDMVESGDAIGGDEEQIVTNFVDVPYLASCMQRQSGQFGLGEHSVQGGLISRR